MTAPRFGQIRYDVDPPAPGLVHLQALSTSRASSMEATMRPTRIMALLLVAARLVADRA